LSFPGAVVIGASELSPHGFHTVDPVPSSLPLLILQFELWTEWLNAGGCSAKKPYHAPGITLRNVMQPFALFGNKILLRSCEAYPQECNFVAWSFLP